MQTEKQKLREILSTLRKALPQHLVQQYSQEVCQLLLDFKAFQDAKHIGYYHAVNNEVSLQSLSKIPGKIFYLPKISEQSLVFCQDIQVYEKNCFGILEPTSHQHVAVEKLDIMLIPMLGFDQNGHRLGMGKAYYDKLLSTIFKKPLLIGVAYSFQERAHIPYETHDQSMDFIITEKTILKCKKL